MTALTWTDDRVEQLKKLWEGGLSASQIAAELGNVTRNAVIGKVHRLGLSGRAKSPSSAAPRPRKARPAQHMMRVTRPVSRGNTALAHVFEVEAEPDPVAFDNVVPMSQRRQPAGTQRGDLPLADRRPQQSGVLFLRWKVAARPAVLRAPLAHRLSAGRRPPPPDAEAHEVNAAQPGPRGPALPSPRRPGAVSGVPALTRRPSSGIRPAPTRSSRPAISSLYARLSTLFCQTGRSALNPGQRARSLLGTPRACSANHPPI